MLIRFRVLANVSLINFPSQSQETKQTALLYTANCGDTEITELLVEMGADIHLTDKVPSLRS